MDVTRRASHNASDMTRFMLLDVMVRMLAIGQLLLIAMVIGRGAAPRTIRLVSAPLLLCVAAYLTVAAPLFRPAHGLLWSVVRLAAQSVPWLLWLFAHCLFERRVDRRVAVIGVATLQLCWLTYDFAGQMAAQARFAAALVQHVVSLLLIAHAMTIALSERSDDLIEKRRRLRVGFVVVVGTLSVVVLVLEMLSGFRHASPGIAFAQASAILIATTAMGIALLQSDPDLLFNPSRPAPAPSLSPAEHVLRQRLDTLIAGAIHREPGLSVGSLADRLDTPEHRLRSLINQRLGYRNFSAFLNHHRIAEAKSWLADPARVDLPILTIAMDLGYGSLATFNRAFRDETGQAPSEFRRAAIIPGCEPS